MSSRVTDNVIELDSGTTSTVSDNLILGGGRGIYAVSGGAISNNTIYSSAKYGIVVGADELSVTSNTIYNSAQIGISVDSAVAPVTGNTIIQSLNGIDLFCVGGNNVHSNTIMGAQIGLGAKPNAANPANEFYNVGTTSVVCQ